MTPQEAIRRIKNHIEVHSRKEPHFAIRIIEALKMAIEALEKQIPKKPIRTDWIFCPNCNAGIAMRKGEQFCFCCGQALDWSDTE